MKVKSLIGLILLETLTVACTKTPTVKTARVSKVDVESTVTTINSGTVDAEQQAVLSFGIVGRVARIFVKNGEQVKSGQKLAQLENTDVQIIFNDANKELQRANQLFSDGLVSRVALDEAKKSLEVARANLDKTLIKAPFDGVITELNLQVGEQSGGVGGKSPVRVIDLMPRLIKGDVDEVDLGKVRVGMPVRVRIPAAGPSPFDASVSRVVPFVDTTKEQDRTSQIEIRMKEPGLGVPVGASAEIEIVVGQKKGALAVPTRVILGGGENRYVYRVAGERTKKIPVKVGMGNYERTEVLQGLSEGDLVVLPEDAVELKEDLKIKTEAVTWP